MRLHPKFPRRRVVVVGWGNSLRRDDGAGLQVVERLKVRWTRRLRTLLGAQPLPEWACGLARADVVYFVDASTDPTVPGFRVTGLEPTGDRTRRGPHHLGPAELLAFCQALYGHAPKAYLVEIAASDLRIGRGFSSRTTAAVARATRWLSARLARSKSSRHGTLLAPSLSRGTESLSEELYARSRSHARLP